MSNEELYEIARRRIDRRNRRWIVWGFDLAGLMLFVAAAFLFSDTSQGLFSRTGLTIALFWGMLLTLHTSITLMAHFRDKDIEREIIKLREADAAMYYEKPKRPFLMDDGEIVDLTNWQHNEAERHLKA